MIDNERIQELYKYFKGKKILMVDDESYVIEPVAEFFEEFLGAEVIVKNNGQEGYETALKEKPDLILSDYVMGPVSGANFAYKLLELNGNPNNGGMDHFNANCAPFIVLSGNSGLEEFMKDTGLTKISTKFKFQQKPINFMNIAETAYATLTQENHQVIDYSPQPIQQQAQKPKIPLTSIIKKTPTYFQPQFQYAT